MILKKKIIFLFDAQDLSTIVSNKLLKIFEELEEDFCLFLMVPDNSPMLPTVLSRAIKLQITTANLNTQELKDFEGIHTPQDLIALLKSKSEDGSPLNEKKFIEQLIQQKHKHSAHAAE